jgi:endonuclease/exonuclease/phosphatase (EEP) superfamily protein YafD
MPALCRTATYWLLAPNSIISLFMAGSAWIRLADDRLVTVSCSFSGTKTTRSFCRPPNPPIKLFISSAKLRALHRRVVSHLA